MRCAPLLVAALLAFFLTVAAAASRPAPGTIRVRLVTSAGSIVIALDGRHAPITTANFLSYCDQQRLDGTVFYRASRQAGDATRGFIEGGIQGDLRRSLRPIPLEPTSKTGIHHLDGAISMARYEMPETATANFSLLSGASPNLDAHGKELGYAAFGHVVEGMAVVRRILAGRTVAGRDGAGDTLALPVRIITARRLDGVAAPAPSFKPWLMRSD